MRTSTRLSDSEFWAFVQSNPFRVRFRGRAHPLQESNGGVDFYAPENQHCILATHLL